MPTSLTADQVIALAPDAASAKAGQGLAQKRQWVSVAGDEGALWGECQGSGKDAYRTQIDLSEPAFRCSCPSRKFPCKHGLGLLLLHVRSPADFAVATRPEWVEAWFQGRSERSVKAEAKAQKKAETRDAGDAPAVADEVARTKRVAQRHERVASGLADCRTWLCDLMRNGLAQAHSQPYKFWEGPAARLVDAQAPGVARLVRELAGAASGVGWEKRLLTACARIHLLLEAWDHIETLPPDLGADVRRLIGWPDDQNALILNPGITGLWSVLGVSLLEEDKLRIRRTWLSLVNEDGGVNQQALVLDFGHVSQPMPVGMLSGTLVRAELVLVPSAAPLRALVKSQQIADSEGHHRFQAQPNLQTAHECFLQQRARQPWLERFPWFVANLLPYQNEQGWFVRDDCNHIVKLATQSCWQLLAESGGARLDLAGEWDGESLLPLAARVGAAGSARWLNLAN